MNAAVAPPTSSAVSDGLATPRRYWAMLAIAVGISMSVLDGAVANIALPTIAHQVRTIPAAAVWIVNAYQMVIVATLLPLAFLGERLGYRRIYTAGLSVFTAGSLACALSDSLPLLIASRVLQGLGASGMLSVNGALVRFIYPQASLGRGVGLNALVVALSATVGPSLASAILSVASWPWLFAVNVPLGVANVILAARALPSSPLSDRRFDAASAALNALVFGLVFLGADELTRARGGAIIAAVELAIAIAGGVVLIRRERAGSSPLIPIDLMRDPVFALSIAASVCAFGAYALAFLALPFHFEAALHRTQVETGLLITPWPAALAVVAPLAGRLSDRVPAAWLGAVGMTLMAAALMLLAFLPAHASTAGIVWRVALGGVGFGLFQSPNNRTLLSSAPRERAGAAGGMLATARLTGMTVGATLAAAFFRLEPRRAEFFSLLAASALSLMAGAVSLLRRPRGR